MSGTMQAGARDSRQGHEASKDVEGSVSVAPRAPSWSVLGEWGQ